MIMRGAHVLQQMQQQFLRSSYMLRMQHTTLTHLGVFNYMQSGKFKTFAVILYKKHHNGNNTIVRYCLNSQRQRFYTSKSKNEDDLVKQNGEQCKEDAKEEVANKIIGSDTKLLDLPQPPKETKSFELKTTKGVLSISTTIEDSKINEIVFEKQDITQTGTPRNKNEKMLLTKAAQMVYASSKNGMPGKDMIKKLPIETKTIPETNVKNTIKVNDAIMKMQIKPSITAATTTIDVNEKPVATAPTPTPPPPPPKPKVKRKRVDTNRSSLERNFITADRAKLDFLLSDKDLENLPKIKRRSPYEQEPPMIVYWRRDVEAKAMEVWGTRENLIKEAIKRDIELKRKEQDIFTVKQRLRDYRREIGARTKMFKIQQEIGLTSKSGRVVLTAIAINFCNFLVKMGGWLYSGSHSMFAECIHSLADLINQIILAYGIYKSQQIPDFDHPYGYSNMRYVSALISGVGIFCVGSGVSFYHGIQGLIYSEPIEDLFWVYFLLGGSLISEASTLVIATSELRRAAKKKGSTFKEYVISGQDPCVNVVLTEDAAAVGGVFVAACCMGLSSWTGSPIYDAVGSLLIGCILAGVASFIIHTNTNALLGRTILPERLEKINAALESDVMIRAIHDIKGIDIGSSLVRYKAELDFDGRELTRFYLDKHDINDLYKTVKSFNTPEELEKFLLDHGENIVDLLGGEIDRIEMNLRAQFPELRHCDLEVL